MTGVHHTAGRDARTGTASLSKHLDGLDCQSFCSKRGQIRLSAYDRRSASACPVISSHTKLVLRAGFAILPCAIVLLQEGSLEIEGNMQAVMSHLSLAFRSNVKESLP